MASTKTTDLRGFLRSLPQVEKLLQSPAAAALLESFPRPEVVRALRETLDDLRARIQALREDRSNGGRAEDAAGLRERLGADAIAAAARGRLESRGRAWYRRVINATGIILHTGLGRAVLPREAVEALASAVSGYTLVEVDPATGERNKREGFAAKLLAELTGAESATVVNNNAAATMIILAALARGREVVISRGQLVEIGGSYRIPDVMQESGAKLVEVGTTNRTYIDDYRKAIGPETGLLLQVHTSNYEIAGFARHTPLEEMVALGRERGLPVVSDLGSGCLVDLSPFGFRKEPLVSDSVRAGADLVCFSGDKLLGGPQAGIIVGKREPVERVRRHPLFRAVRVDKMTLAALEAVLRLYRDPARLFEAIPALRMISMPPDEVRRRARRFARALARAARGIAVEVVREAAQTGSGSLPAQDLPTWAAAVEVAGTPPDRLAAHLRAGDPPIFARIRSDRVLFDFRTLLPGEEKTIIAALAAIAGGKGRKGNS